MKLTNRKMKLTNRKAGTPKRRMTEERFDKAKSLFAHGLKAQMVADLVEMHYTTANRIDKCDSYEDYRAANLAKSARRQELEDARIGTTAFTPTTTPALQLPVTNGNATYTGTTAKTGAVDIKTPDNEFTGNVYIAGESFWTFHHAAKCFNVSYGTIKKLVEVNKITCNKIGHRYFIPVTSLRDYLTSTD
jgi:hypothetical protein|tara:strand:+ start:489 stop:1058 length:570 start_codon:yes stop_codon:yes gene_type:complete